MVRNKQSINRRKPIKARRTSKSSAATVRASKTKSPKILPAKGSAPSVADNHANNCAVRASSKLAEILTLLRQPGGTTLDALCAATGWQSHSVRGALSGSIKKRLGSTVHSEKTGGVRTYRIAE